MTNINAVENQSNLQSIAVENPETQTVLNFRVDGNTLLALTRKLYQDNFFVIWAREVVQNSVDAKATSVIIKNDYGTEDCERTRLIVEDDGTGMTPYIVVNAFLALGESIKPEDLDAVGGFGVAKAIVLNGNYKGKSPYSDTMVYWYVITTAEFNGELKTYYFDSEMIGKEALKEIKTEEKTGTKIVVYREERSYNAKDELFRRVLENCNVRTELIYNDAEVKQLKRARKKFSTDWCEVFYKKDALSHQENYAIVRINGVYQFRTYVSSRMNGTAVVEIKSPFKPTDDFYPLTPNREQVKEDYRNQLDQILDSFKSTEINIEEEEEFTFEVWNNPNYNRSSYSYYGEEEINHYSRETANELVMIEEKIEELEEKVEKAVDEEEKESYIELLKYEQERREEERKRLAEAHKKEEQQKLTKEIESYWSKIKNSVRSEDELNLEIDNFEEVFNVNLSSIAIKKDKKVKTNIDLFNEKNLKVLYTAKVFADMIFQFSDYRIYKYNYVIGWTITDTARAEFWQKDGNTFILVNPVGLKISDTRLFTANLVQRLVHEILHREYYYHDEAFIAKFHKIMEECINPNIRLFEKVARAILKKSH